MRISTVIRFNVVLLAVFMSVLSGSVTMAQQDSSSGQAPAVKLSAADQGIDLRPYVRVLRNDAGDIDLDEARARFAAGSDIFEITELDRIDGRVSNYWIHLRLVNDLDQQAHRFIFWPYERVIQADFYTISDGGKPDLYPGGILAPTGSDVVVNRIPNAQLIFRPGDTIDVFLRATDFEYLQLPLRLKYNLDFYHENHFNFLLIGSTLGLLIAAFIYLAIMSRLTTDWSVPVLILYLLFTAGYTAVLTGLTRDVFGYFGDYQTLAMMNVLILGLWGSGILFSRIHLVTDQIFPTYDRVLLFSAGLCAALAVLALFLPQFVGRILSYLPYFLTLVLIGLTTLVVKRKVRGTRDWVLGASLAVTGVICYYLADFGVIPMNGLTGNSLYFGAALAGIAFTSSVTEKIRTIQRERDSRQRAIVNSSLDGIITAGFDGKIVDFNPAAEKMFGYGRGEAIGKSWTDLILAPRMRERVLAHQGSVEPEELIKVLPKEPTRSISIRKNGEEFPIEFTVTQSTVDDTVFFTGHIRDMTEVRKFETELERQRDLLFQSEKLSALGALLAGVAHELNNPLSIVVGRASMLKESALDEKVRKSATKIHEAANRCTRIVRTFLAMARQRPHRAETTNLNEIVDTALELVAYNLRDDNIDVEVVLDPDLPETRADPDQLTQVLINLIVNAHHALKDLNQKRIVKITTRYFAEGDYFQICVEDNGPGVAGDVRNRIFDPFYTTKPVGSGTGLGLSVSQGMVQTHGGSLEYFGSGLGGAGFDIKLPRRRGIDRGQESAALSKRMAKRHAEILVIDDDAEGCEMMADLLSSRGFMVDWETDALKALNRLREHDYQIVLSDIRMPGLDGAGLYEILEREQSHYIDRLIFITGDAVNRRTADLKLRSRRPILDKPVEVDELVATIQIVLEQKPDKTGDDQILEKV